MAKSDQLVTIVIVIAIIFVVFKTGMLNSLISGLKSAGSQIGSGIGGGGGGTTATAPPSTTFKQTTATSNGKGLDVSGKNSCACRNGECIGNCSNGASIDPSTFDPFRFVEENT